MKILLLGLALVGCGYSSKDNEVIGQVKKVIHVTPLICPDFDVLDLSLGVMRNGVGSMSTEDMQVVVSNSADSKFLQESADKGKLVKIKYSKKRVVFCTPDKFLAGVEAVQ